MGGSEAVEGPEQIGVRSGRPAGPGEVAVMAPDVGVEEPGAGEDVYVAGRAVAKCIYNLDFFTIFVEIASSQILPPNNICKSVGNEPAMAVSTLNPTSSI